ncbi:MAG: hypothetical protein QG629_886 [Patescibacteria group bacterium]|nr:hypothetical protein [Candidatus Saccharibacteria bacterium]MDQ5963803.1 hypothetical protein [Patescibacteria group bacterium]
MSEIQPRNNEVMQSSREQLLGKLGVSIDGSALSPNSPDEFRESVPDAQGYFEGLKNTLGFTAAVGALATVAVIEASSSSIRDSRGAQWAKQNRKLRKEASREAAQASIEQANPEAPYDPLAGWSGGHRKRKLADGLLPEQQSRQDPLTGREDRSTFMSMRANLRRDAIDKRRMEAEAVERLYGEDIGEKTFSEVFSDDNMTIKQKTRMWLAARNVRSLDDSSKRIDKRLRKQAGQ